MSATIVALIGIILIIGRCIWVYADGKDRGGRYGH